MAVQKKSRPVRRLSKSAKPRLSKSKETPKKTTRKPTSRQLMLADLKRSGLTEGDARRAGYKPLTAKQVQSLTGNYAAGYLITYYDVNGQKTDYYRVRYTEEVKGPFGAAKTRPLRYTGPRDELPRFHFPRRVDWKALASDTDEPLVITEGEKKAEAACNAGIPCFSVPGVWAWRSKKKGIAAIPDFNVIKWKGRKVYLCFDNDVMTNPQVIAALNAFGHELTNRGAKIIITHLPKGPGKIGLDDFLLKRKADAFMKLRQEAYAESARLWHLNGRLAWINSVGATYDLAYKRFYKSKAELLYAFANEIYLVPKSNGDGFKEVNAAEQWLKWPHRLTFDDLNYLPGQPETVDKTINTWPGYAVQPAKGNVKPFLDLVRHIFGKDRKAEKWFLQWCAYPLQHPGTKLAQAVLFHSLTQGVGKSLVGEILGDIYGENFNIVSQDELHSPFNEWQANKQFIVGEEITGRNSRVDADRLKNMITRQLFNVNKKFQPTYQQNDYVAYLLTSNQPDAAFLDTNDRRYFVHEITAEPANDKFYERVSKSRRNGGASHLFYYLLHEVDTSNYNPKAKAPTTESKQQMIELSKSDVDRFAIDIIRNPDAVLLSGRMTTCDQELVDTDAITAMADRSCSRPVSSNAVSRALRRAGITPRIVRVGRRVITLWPVRNTEKWDKAKPAQWSEQYAKYEANIKF